MEDDFLFEVKPKSRTTFDEFLRNEWDTKMNEGKVFWYKLNITLQRTVSDKFILQVSAEVQLASNINNYEDVHLFVTV